MTQVIPKVTSSGFFRGQLIATSCTSPGCSSSIWVAIGVWSIPGTGASNEKWSRGQEAKSTPPTFNHGQGISIPQDEPYLKMELPLLSTFKVTSLSPAKTKKDLVFTCKKAQKKTQHHRKHHIPPKWFDKWHIEWNHPPGHCKVARLPGSMRLSKAIIIFICCSSCSKAWENPNGEGKLCPRDFSGVHPLWHFSKNELHTITYMLYICVYIYIMYYVWLLVIYI